jgi:UrcA family protein
MSNTHEHEASVMEASKPKRALQLARVILACLLGSVAATASLAAPPRLETTEIRVSYNHSELISASAARGLLRRIRDAALESCGASSFSLAEFKTATESSQCWRDAVDDAVRRIGSPTLSAVASAARR